MAEGRDPESSGQPNGGLDGSAAVALALGATREPATAETIDAFLQDQRALIARQLEGFDEQQKHLRLKHFDQWLSVSLKLLTAAVGALAVGLAGLMVWNARQADGLVVEAFSVPPDLARQGVTGTVVAAAILDQLARLDREANTAQALAISDGWSAQSHVEIPQTGVSLDEVDRLLRRWLGRETHITGEATMTAPGIALSARGAGGDVVRVTGGSNELPELAARVAEQLLAQARPVEYGRMLNNRGDPEAAIRIFGEVIEHSDSTSERAEAYLHLGGLYLIRGRNAEAGAQLLEAIKLGGHGGHLLLTFVEHGRGHNQAAAAESALAVAEEGHENAGDPRLRAEKLAEVRMHHALIVGSYQAGERLLSTSMSVHKRGGFDLSNRQDHMDALIGLHQPGDARREVPTMQRTTRTPERSESFRTAVMLKAAGAEENWPDLLQTIAAGSTNPTRSLMDAPSTDAWKALALARMGRAPEALALAATLPGDCYRCLRIRGEIAEVTRDRPGADRWFAEAVRQAPALPFAQTDWGRVKLARGDFDGALSLARDAHDKTRDFADPLELWGEALSAKGDHTNAAAKLAEAAAFAPGWGRLHLKWGEALAKAGRPAEAQAQFKAAAGLDLTAAERAELAAQKS